MSESKTTKDPKNQELVITRIFDAPRENVWKARTDPDLMKRLGDRWDLRLYIVRSPNYIITIFYSYNLWRDKMKPDRLKARNTMMRRMKLKVHHVDYCNKTKEPQDDFPRY